MRYGEEGIEGAGALNLPVRLVEGVSEVEEEDCELDTAAVAGVTWGGGLGMGLAGPNEEGVEDSLGVVCCELSNVSWIGGNWENGERTSGR